MYPLGAYLVCHPRENGDPGVLVVVDSRLRGNDRV